MGDLEPRTVLGLTAESWFVVAFVLSVVSALVAGCWQDVKDLLGSLFAGIGEPREDDDEPFSRASFKEAQKARTAIWTRRPGAEQETPAARAAATGGAR